MFSINPVSKFIRNIQFQEKIERRGCNECTTVDKQKRARNNLSRGMVNAGLSMLTFTMIFEYDYTSFQLVENMILIKIMERRYRDQEGRR